MKYDENIKSASQIMETHFAGFLAAKEKEFSSLDTGWQKVLMNIPKDGEKLASHSEIKEIKKGYMYIQTDHPAWVQLLQLHKKKILILIKKEFASLEIKDFFCLIKEKNK